MRTKIKTIVATLVGYDIEGIAGMNMWGGGTGEIEMNKTYLPVEHFSKDNVMRCVNDGGFGCSSIDYANIEITERYSNGGTGDSIWIYASSDYNKSLFLGWKHLMEIGAIK